MSDLIKQLREPETLLPDCVHQQPQEKGWVKCKKGIGKGENGKYCDKNCDKPEAYVCEHKWEKATPNPYGITHHCSKCNETSMGKPEQKKEGEGNDN